MKQDPVKKIFGKSADELLSHSNLSSDQNNHAKFHSPNAFCGNAGEEEMKHFNRLVESLSDSEVIKLADAVGLKFLGSTNDLIDIDTLAGTLDETDRELFYREYYKIIDNRTKKK